MPATDFLETAQGRRLAYHLTPGAGPVVVFLGGLKSDMEGTKAVFLEEWAKKQGRAFLRFDYSGHGESSGEFTEGCIGDWAEDTAEAVAALTDGPILPAEKCRIEADVWGGRLASCDGSRPGQPVVS